MLSTAAGCALLALLLVQGATAQGPAAESSISSVPSGGFSEVQKGVGRLAGGMVPRAEPQRHRCCQQRCQQRDR